MNPRTPQQSIFCVGFLGLRPLSALGLLVLVPLLVLGCGRASKPPQPDSGTPNDSPAASSLPPQDQVERQEESASQPALPSRERESTMGHPRGTGSAPAPAAVRSKNRAAENKAAVSSDDTLSPQTLEVRPEDSAELRAALVDFDRQLTQLSEGQACEDACKALESLTRAAEHICQLVLRKDPEGRCTKARQRVTEAGRALAQRCGSCVP